MQFLCLYTNSFHIVYLRKNLGIKLPYIKKEFKIELGRPRVQGSLDVTYMVSDILKVLKEEVEKVAKAEYDSDWTLEKDSVLSDVDNTMDFNL